MRFAFCVVALSLCSTIQARPEGDYGTEGKGRYFEHNLDGLQGALEDISKAGEDLATLETKLEGLVDGSGLIYKAESVLENSVGKDVKAEDKLAEEQNKRKRKLEELDEKMTSQAESDKKHKKHKERKDDKCHQ